jgi:hypothetical protein
MPTFRLGECTLELKIEPLAGALAQADRQWAWRLYLMLVARPALRSDELSAEDVRDFIAALQAILEDWPAAQIENPRPEQLGHVMATVIQMILMPCLVHGRHTPAAWTSVREFCHALARELASLYRFPDASANVPQDLLAAWQAGA